jgi:DnaJ-class molecular chaperone
MPYCPKCGNFYYAGSSSCSTCGGLFVGQAEKKGGTSGEYKTARKQARDKRCPYCNSTGRVAAPVGRDVTETCPVCKGRRFNLILEDWQQCKRCKGKGEYTYSIVRKPCLECKGTGWLEN